MLSYPTMQFYRSLWAKLKKAQKLTEADRKPLHAQLGLPDSSKDFSPEDFDRWKGHCLAILEPDNTDAQIAQIRQPATRKLHFIGHLLTALELSEAYAEGVVAKMNSKGAFGGRFLTLQTMPPRGLDTLRNKLKDLCRKRWPEKVELLGQIAALRLEFPALESSGAEAVARELRLPGPVDLAGLDYEDLLVALSVLRALAGCRRVAFDEPAAPELEPALDNAPF
jgi:hypothetical protein